MIFRRKTRRPALSVLLAGGMFILLAVVGWGVPVSDILYATFMTLLVLLLLALPAILINVIVWIYRRLRDKQGRDS